MSTTIVKQNDGLHVESDGYRWHRDGFGRWQMLSAAGDWFDCEPCSINAIADYECCLRSYEIDDGPKYPRLLGVIVRNFRRQAHVRDLTHAEKQQYGAAVGEAIRKLQRTELQRTLTPTPPLTYKYHWKPANNPFAAYSRPNPFRMAGDPEDRSEMSLYKHAMQQKAP